MRRLHTAAIATLGCKLNQSESYHMARQLSEAGLELVPFGEPADLYVINSCTVTHVGDRKSRQLIRQAFRANPEGFVVVAGCYAELEPDKVAAIEGVGAVIGNRGKARLVETLRDRGLLVGERASERVGDGETGGLSTQHPAPSTDPAPNTRHSVSTRTRAFVKIQEGCDNRCSYCIVPVARGQARSLPTAEILSEIRALAAEGYQEIVLTGVNITAYGRDHASPDAREAARGMGLVRLLEAILRETEIPRVRLSSLQPEDWNARFYELWGAGRLCRHLHLSLQSGSDAVLRRMRRRYSTSLYARIVEEARRELPGVAVTTDVIAGFPGETEAEHGETEAFLRAIAFAGLHVFKYSPRRGTDAASVAGQVDARVKQERSERLIALADEMSRGFRRQFEGAVLPILWEEPVPPTRTPLPGLAGLGGTICWTGMSDNYIRVYAPGDESLGGTISGARVGEVVGDGVAGALVRG